MHLCCQHGIGNEVKVVLGVREGERESERQTDRESQYQCSYCLTGSCSQTDQQSAVVGVCISNLRAAKTTDYVLAHSK